MLSIDRGTPTAETTGAGSVVFKVTFDQAVTGVTADDFKVFTSVDAKANPTVSLSGTGAVYDVTISGLRGNGEVRLDLVDNDSIGVQQGPPEPIFFPLGGFGTGNGSFTGDTYHLLQVAPKVDDITKLTPSPTEATSVSWTVTFSEAVTGVDVADFLTAQTNTLTAPTGLNVTPISPVSGAATSYTVATTGTLMGLGDITLSLKDNFTIKDSDGNLLQASTPNIDPKSEAIGGNGVAIATGDLNGDGKADVVTLNSGANALNVRLGNGDGTYTDKPISGRFAKFIGVAVADVNGDGKPDLLVAGQTFSSSSGNVSVALGNGDGTFQTQTEYGSAGDSPRAIKVSDLNGDGRQDIVLVANSSGNPVVSVLLGNANGSFQPTINYAAGTGANALAIGDLDGDGDMDVVTANSSDTVSVLLGNGTGGLGTKSDFPTGPTALSPVAVALGDLNGDGRPDLVVGNASGDTSNSVTVLLADATPAASFTSTRTLATGLTGATDVAVADYNGDGFLDIASAGNSVDTTAARPAEGVAPLAAINGAMVNISLGGGNGTFLNFGTFPTGGITGTGHLVVGDFNGDGKADLAAITSGESNLRTLLNLSPGDFEGEAITRAIVAPDLAVTTVTDGKTSAIPGDTLTYTITYKNLTSKGATGVTLTTFLDQSLDFIGSENTGWTQSGSMLTKVITGTVAGNSTTDTSLKLHVKTTIGGGFSSIGTTTTITDDGTHGTDPDKSNNQSSDFDQLTGLTADVAVTKIDDPALAVPGQNGTYTVHFKNSGNAAAFGTLTVTLPTGVSFSTVDNPTWTYDSNAGTIRQGATVPGGGAEQTVQFTLGFGFASSALSTTASFATLSSPSDSNLENNSLTEITPIYSGFYVTSPGVAVGKKFAPPVIRVFDRATGEEVRAFFAYEQTYRDSIRVAVGDFNDDGVDDIVTTTQNNGGRMRVFDGLTGLQFTDGPWAQEIGVFVGKKTGAFVAVGDVTGDGQADVVVGSALGGAQVKVYDGNTAAVIKEYTPFGTKFKGGVRVAVAEVGNPIIVNPGLSPAASAEISRDSWAMADIIVGMGYGGGQVKVYSGATDTVLQDFKVGKKGYRGGVSVAAGDLDGDGLADLVIGRNSGKPSIVEVFSGRTLAPIGLTINPFDLDPLKPKNTFGVRVAVVDVNLDGVADIITSVGVKNGSKVKIFSGIRGTDGAYHELTDRTLTAYADFPNVALWVAGSVDRVKPQ